MEQLPDRARTEALRVQADRYPVYPIHVVTLPEGITDERITIRIPKRMVQVELRVLDAATGEPVRMLTARAQLPSDAQNGATLIRDPKTGYRTGVTERGPHTLVVDALDHEDLRKEVDIQPDADGRFVYTVRLVRLRPDSQQVGLTVRVTDAAAGTAIERVRIEVQDAETGEALSAFEGRREGGEFLMPAPSGPRRIVVSAEGHETWTKDVDLPPDPGAVTVDVALRPR
jgi:hypothetical protein